MEISARNQLKGQIQKIIRGSVMGEVIVDVGGQAVTSSISLASIDRLGLMPGDSVVAIIKATDVMIGK
jgi:molybdopterin-binding protein